VPDPDTAVQEPARVLRPGGRPCLTRPKLLEGRRFRLLDSVASLTVRERVADNRPLSPWLRRAIPAVRPAMVPSLCMEGVGSGSPRTLPRHVGRTGPALGVPAVLGGVCGAAWLLSADWIPAVAGMTACYAVT
jgi:hypothetical protein